MPIIHMTNIHMVSIHMRKDDVLIYLFNIERYVQPKCSHSVTGVK